MCVANVIVKEWAQVAQRAAVIAEELFYLFEIHTMLQALKKSVGQIR